jgi:protein-L-isoaspartate(D-aspartate) O-methyltransferase
MNIKKIKFTTLIFASTLSILFSINIFSQDEAEYARMRERMVDIDLKGRDIADKKVLEIMGQVPRHLFVDKDLRWQAYSDNPLPIDEGQTISQPYIVALMTQELKLKPGEKVLEIGTGSGYQAAVLSEITDQVYTVEIKQKLAAKVRKTFEKLGYAKIKSKQADGYFGWEEYAPFDAIIITAAVNLFPPPLIKQLKEGGRLILPLGSTQFFQNLTLATKQKGKLKVRYITSVRFVPLVGEALKQ